MFDYMRPSTLEEATALLERYSDRAMLIAGGTDVMVGIQEKKFSPDLLISLKRIEGFDSVVPRDRGLRIGAMATHRQIADSQAVRAGFSALADAAGRIGSMQIRNVATIGGNISNGLPSADTACPLLVFDARVRIKGPLDERILPLREFHIGPGKTVLKRNEILLEFMIPPAPAASASAYWKQGRRQAMEIAILGMAMVLAVDAADPAPLKEAFTRNESLDRLFAALDDSEISCREARIALGVAAPTPIRVAGAEGLLRGKKITSALLLAAGRCAAEEAQPRDSMRAPAWYRRRLIEVLPRRLALQCLERALLPAGGHESQS
jgi:CO/xanthine dehydrogenase FAD-binding subunit